MLEIVEEILEDSEGILGTTSMELMDIMFQSL